MKVFTRNAVLADTHVAGGDAPDGAVLVVKHFSGREAGEYVNTQAFGLLRHPARDRPEADDVVAVILEALGQKKVRCAKAGFFTEKNHAVIGDRLVQRRAHGFPVRKQLVHGDGVHDGTRENVGARLGAFLQHHHRNVFAFFGGQLLETDGSGQATWAATDDDDVVVHRFTRAELGQNF